MILKYEEIDIEENFKQRVEALWKAEKFKELELIKFGYSIQKNLIKNSILFIGINPSNSDDSIKKEFYYSPQDGSHHKYFKKFSEVSNKTNIPWSHIDLLFVRKTDQKSIPSLENKCGNVGKEFLSANLQISKELIELCSPQVIVVNNTLAKKYMGKNTELANEWIGYVSSFDNTAGTHFINNCKQLSGVPVFFTSMLTGQRALDNGSFERLIWHINFVTKFMNKTYN